MHWGGLGTGGGRGRRVDSDRGESERLKAIKRWNEKERERVTKRRWNEGEKTGFREVFFPGRNFWAKIMIYFLRFATAAACRAAQPLPVRRRAGTGARGVGGCREGAFSRFGPKKFCPCSYVK